MSGTWINLFFLFSLFQNNERPLVFLLFIGPTRQVQQDPYLIVAVDEIGYAIDHYVILYYFILNIYQCNMIERSLFNDACS
jgi:hypothetical protein